MHTLHWMLMVAVSMSVMLDSSKCGVGSTPKETVKNFRDGLINNDANQMAACFDTNEDNKAAIAATCELAVTMNSFSNKMIAEYGKDAMGKNTGINSLEALKDDNWLEQLQIEENGDKAVVSPPKGKKVSLIKKGGKWYIDIGMMTNGKTKPEDMEKNVQIAQKMTAAFNNCANKIGQAGYDAKKINAELMKEILQTVVMQQGNK